MSIKKEFIKNVILSILVMFVLPLLVVLFAKPDAGMAMCFILFYAINPVYSVLLGVRCGKNINKLWIIPIISSIIYIISSWLLFEFKEIAFVIYGFIYLILSIFSMYIAYFVETRFKKNNEK